MQLDASLAQLESAQLIRHISEEEATYMFKNALTQDATYQSLLVKQRRGIHRHVAQAYEAIYADRCLDEFAALLAQHYEQAGDDVQALIFTHRAGDNAARLYAHAEAIAHYTRALEITANLGEDSHPAMQELYLKRGRTFELNSQYDLALANYEAMETRARERGDRALELAALMARATIYSIPSKQSDRPLANALCDQALDLARALGDQPAEAKILWNLLLLNTRLATNYKLAIGYGEQALAIARKLDLREQLAYLLNDLSLPFTYAGDPERGEQVNLEARQMWREWNNLPMLSDNLSYATMMDISLGEYEQAIDTSREALAISQSIGNVWGESFSQSWVGQAYRELGQITQAIAVMQDAIRLAAFGFQAPLSFTRADLACLYGDLGMVAQGIELARVAHVESSKQAQVMVAWTSAQLGHLYLLDGQIAAAEAVIQKAIQSSASADFETLFGTAVMLAEAELMLAQHEYPRAIQVCDRLIGYKRAYRLRQYLPNALYLKGIALQRQGNLADALASFAEARAEAESTNTLWMLWRILAALAEIEIEHGNHDQAKSLRTQARETIEYIVSQTPEEFRASFLKLPEVRAVMEN